MKKFIIHIRLKLNIILELIIKNYRKYCPNCHKGLLSVYNFLVPDTYYCQHCDEYYYKNHKKIMVLPEDIKIDRQFRILLYKFCGYKEGFWDTSENVPIWLQKLYYIQNIEIERINFLQHAIRDTKGIVKDWVYNFPVIYNNIDYIGDEIVNILKIHQFKTDLLSNLYIKFNPFIEENMMNIHRIDQNSLEVDYGLLPDAVNRLNYRELAFKLKQITFHILKELFKNSNDKLKKIIDIEQKYVVMEDKKKRITYIDSEEDFQKISLSYEITSSELLNVFVTYTNKETKSNFELVYYHLFRQDDLRLIDKVYIEDGLIMIEPKNKKIMRDDKSGMSYYFYYRRFSIEHYLNCHN